MNFKPKRSKKIIDNLMKKEQTQEEFKEEIREYLFYDLIISMFIEPEMTNRLELSYTYLDKIEDAEFDKIKHKMRADLNLLYDASIKVYPIKVTRKEFTAKFKELFESGEPIITIGELIKYIDLSYQDVLNAEDHPLHTKVLLTKNVREFQIEDRILLGDAFYLKAKADVEVKKFEQHKKRHDGSEHSHKYFGLLNQNASLYYRLSCISFYAAVESFVNSIGYNYLLINENKIDKSMEEYYKLQGYKLTNNDKRLYLNIRDKIKFLVKTISNEESVVNIAEEPYKTFFEHIDLRDSSVHFSPTKTKIKRRTNEWVNIVNKISESSIDVCKKVWKMCYPDQELPKYMSGFDREFWDLNTKNRIDTEIRMNPLKN